MLDKPKIVQTIAQLTAVIPLKIAKDPIRVMMGPGIQELMSTVAAQGIKPTGAWMSRHFKIDESGWDFEITIPVATAVKPQGRVTPSELSPRKVARAIYRGPYEGLATAWQELDGWARANGHSPAVDLWEQYVKGPESGTDPSKWETELNRPLA